MTRTVHRRPPAGKPQSRSLKAFLDSGKRETRLLGSIERHLLAQGPDEYRLTPELHAGELAKPDVCPLALYYRLTRPVPHEVLRLRSQTIFGEGHAIHAKWQTWLANMGVLRGTWECPSCSHHWLDTVPTTCPRCNWCGQKNVGHVTNMWYREVVLRSKEHNIIGHADGWVDDDRPSALLEVKSIGTGTVRIEAPSLLNKHDGDLAKLWRDIRRPFPSHLRQGHLYLALAGLTGIDIDHMVFIYENKADQAVKEFVVEHDTGISDPMLELALDVKWAIERQRPPDCPKEAGCKHCKTYETDDSGAPSPSPAVDGDDAGSQGTSVGERSVASTGHVRRVRRRVHGG